MTDEAFALINGEDMPITRFAKIIMCLSLALFCLLVSFDNIFSYGANYQFVRHVLSMDTTFPNSPLSYRAIDDVTAWHLAYAAIIAAEAVTGVLFLAGAIALWRARKAPGAMFNRAKRLGIMAALVAFLVWFFGFTVVGGEWFAMWESRTWNGQDAAFRFYATTLAVLIFLNQPDPDLEKVGF